MESDFDTVDRSLFPHWVKGFMAIGLGHLPARKIEK